MKQPYPAGKARQGRKGFPVLAILGISLALAVFAWIGTGFYADQSDDGMATGSVNTSTPTEKE